MITETMQNANTQKSEMETLKEHTEKENQILMARYYIFILLIDFLIIVFILLY